MADEGGVLGNLPNARPGRRSAKRDRPAKAAEEAAVRAEATGKPAAEPARASRPKSPTTKAATARRRTTAVKGSESGDPVGAVVRGAAGVAIAGAKVAGALTQELFRRLPRP